MTIDSSATVREVFSALAISLGVFFLSVILPVYPGESDSAQFTPQYLSNPENIALGREVWLQRCQFCHGKTAYPGKAPKLEPSRYTPEFVYDRVTNGFRGMPSWKQEFSEQQLRAVTAYVMSKEFSN